MSKTASYTAASGVLPTKVLLNERLVKSITQGKMIPPIHVQLNPTNTCNLKCDWCSCSNSDRQAALSRVEIAGLMEEYKALGCEGVTITGGGEPLLHPGIDDIVQHIHGLGISMGLVTNGWRVRNLAGANWDKITWARVSLGDGRERELADKGYWDGLRDVAASSVDLSFSYVLTDNPNLPLIFKMVEFANEHGFTHVRLTTDIVQRNVETLPYVKGVLQREAFDDSLVICQDRTAWTRGQKNCYISLLKPVISAEGKIYPCCGAQYFDPIPARRYKGCMGDIQDILKIFEKQAMYDGSKCMVCYYSHYNQVLGALLEDVEHREFV
jgi:MoaA/NifB/PqqE/SkfB family radical SAM enzyme